MLIACLGWGSLLWDPRDLPIRGNLWFTDGPFLPIEFARKSIDGRMTLVLVTPTHPLVRSLWKPMLVQNLNEARTALGVRECRDKKVPRACVDYWPGGSRNKFVIRAVGRWARQLQVDAVVWTNLPPKSVDGQERVPTAGEVVAYLRALRGHEQTIAKKYIRMAPRQIITEYRTTIERTLRWGCKSLI